MGKFSLFPSNTNKVDEGHPSQDNTGRFALDQLLRKHGFRIMSRPRGAEAVWVKGGKKYYQTEALYTLDMDSVLDAEYCEFLQSSVWDAEGDIQ